MSSSKRRRIRVDQFKKQLAENVIGADGLIELEIGQGHFVTIYIPLGSEEREALAEALKSAGDDHRAGALVVLDHNPARSADEQLEAWESAGLTVEDLMRIYQVETQDALERLGKFRYKG